MVFVLFKPANNRSVKGKKQQIPAIAVVPVLSRTGI